MADPIYTKPDYVTSRVENWKQALGQLTGHPCHALEVGSLEGRSALWFLDNILTHPDSRIMCVDPWAWNPVHEENFDRNTRECVMAGKLVKVKDYAEGFLRSLTEELDFAYLDGSKEAQDFLACAVLVWPHIKPGGVLIFDDYAWVASAGEKGPKLPPKPGINAFLELWAGEYDLIHRSWQVIIRKRAAGSVAVSGGPTMLDMYPPFSFSEVAPAYEHLFRIHSDSGPLVDKPEVVVSTSLYWGVRQPTETLPELSVEAMMSRPIPDKKNAKRTWWQTYVNPLVLGAHQKLPNNWERRVYLARNLEFLRDVLPPSIRIIVMEESCGVSMPGMLWRYIPMMEDTMCVARGADNYMLPEKVITMARQAIKQGVMLARHTNEPPLNPENNKFQYRPVCGSCITRGPMPFMENATNWLRVNREERHTLSRTFDGMHHTGMHRWDAFSQDEQFLCRWLYHEVVKRKGRVLTEPRPDQLGKFYRMDADWLEQHGCEHHVFYP